MSATLLPEVTGDAGTWPLSDRVFVHEEPELEFRHGQRAVSPQIGLGLFGPYDGGEFQRPRGLVLAGIGTSTGLASLSAFLRLMQRPVESVRFDPDAPLSKEAYLWPSFPGFAAAYHCELPEEPTWSRLLDEAELQEAASIGNQYKRAKELADRYLNALRIAQEQDHPFDVAVCVIPDTIWKHCRPKSRVPGDGGVWVGVKERENRKGTLDLFDARAFDEYDFSVDFRRQLKARAMAFKIPIQIVRESTLLPREVSETDARSLTKLSDRAWNLSNALYYKAGGRPWRLAGARPGVCYVGIAFRREEGATDPRSACCAAQMFLQSGDGVVFRGEFGPWFSPSNKEFHLNTEGAEALLSGVIKAYREQGGEELKEIFLHARSDISREEWSGYQRACPPGVKLVGVRVQPSRDELRLYRPGNWVVLRGTTWIQGPRRAYLWGSGFKPAVLSYDGAETPRPLRIDIQHGVADIEQVSKDILALTKLNYNTCRVGDAEPVTVRFSDAVGEILIGNPTVKGPLPQFKYYI